MKRAAMLALMISLALLCGCAAAQHGEEDFQQWRQEFLSSESRIIEAEVEALSDESETVFLLRLHCSAENDKVEILAPEELAHVSAHISDEDNTLCYDGAVLSLGGEATQRISPMMALPMLMDFLREGHFEYSWSETLEDTAVLVTELEDGQGRKMQLFQDKDSMQPRFASIRSGDETELKIRIQKIE